MEGLCSTQRLNQSFQTGSAFITASLQDTHMYTHAPSPVTGHCRQIQLLIHRQVSAQLQELPTAGFHRDLKTYNSS